MYLIITFAFWTGEWARDSFNNGDIVDLLNAMSVLGIGEPRDRLYTIVKSSVKTSMDKYKLYTKALGVLNRVNPRAERRKRRQTNICNPSTSFVECVECGQVLCMHNV